MHEQSEYVWDGISLRLAPGDALEQFPQRQRPEERDPGACGAIWLRRLRPTDPDFDVSLPCGPDFDVQLGRCRSALLWSWRPVTRRGGPGAVEIRPGVGLVSRVVSGYYPKYLPD